MAISLLVQVLFLVAAVSCAPTTTGVFRGENVEAKCFIQAPPTLPGPCKARNPDVYYDRALNKCVEHVYGGCGVGGYGFGSVQECENVCLVSIPSSPPAEVTTTTTVVGIIDSGSKHLSKNPLCNLPAPEPGKIACLAYIPAFRYDVETGECVKFIYGGCGGNANRFATPEECQAACI